MKLCKTKEEEKMRERERERGREHVHRGLWSTVVANLFDQFLASKELCDQVTFMPVLARINSSKKISEVRIELDTFPSGNRKIMKVFLRDRNIFNMFSSLCRV